jgi:hypothetical protein
LSRGGRSKQRTSLSLAAWLGFVAMSVQIFIPVLLGVEIGILSSGAAQAGETLHDVSEHAAGLANDTHAKGGHAHTADCPICLALAAGMPHAASPPPAMP